MKRLLPHPAGLLLGAGLLSLSLIAAPLATAGLEAGASQVDITPPPGLEMYGFYNRITEHKHATGTLDPLYARVLVLQAADHRLALVTLDLGRTFNEAWLQRLRDAAKAESGVDALIVTASHTHSGPNILDIYPDNRPPEWEEAALTRISGAIHDLSQHLEAARIGTGFGNASISYNRRKVDPEGHVTMFWTNPEKVPNGPVDSTVGVIRVDRGDGSPIAILVNYACHPTVLRLRQPAVFLRLHRPDGLDGGLRLRREAGLLLPQGAAGDINPYFDGTPLAKGGLEKREWTGHELGAEAARVAQAIKTEEASTPSIDFADDVMGFPWRWEPKKFRDDLVRVHGPLLLQDHADILAAPTPPKALELHVTTLLINRQIAIMGMPGEPFVNFQQGWRDRCPIRTCFFLGYANGYYDYFPTILAASQGGYGAADSDTYVAVGAGERMLDHAVIRAQRMLGQLNDVPQATPYAPRYTEGAPRSLCRLGKKFGDDEQQARDDEGERSPEDKSSLQAAEGIARGAGCRRRAEMGLRPAGGQQAGRHQAEVIARRRDRRVSIDQRYAVGLRHLEDQAGDRGVAAHRPEGNRRIVAVVGLDPKGVRGHPLRHSKNVGVARPGLGPADPQVGGQRPLVGGPLRGRHGFKQAERPLEERAWTSSGPRFAEASPPAAGGPPIGSP